MDVRSKPLWKTGHSDRNCNVSQVTSSCTCHIWNWFRKCGVDEKQWQCYSNCSTNTWYSGHETLPSSGNLPTRLDSQQLPSVKKQLMPPIWFLDQIPAPRMAQLGFSDRRSTCNHPGSIIAGYCWIDLAGHPMSSHSFAEKTMKCMPGDVLLAPQCRFPWDFCIMLHAALLIVAFVWSFGTVQHRSVTYNFRYRDLPYLVSLWRSGVPATKESFLSNPLDPIKRSCLRTPRPW